MTTEPLSIAEAAATITDHLGGPVVVLIERDGLTLMSAYCTLAPSHADDDEAVAQFDMQGEDERRVGSFVVWERMTAECGPHPETGHPMVHLIDGDVTVTVAWDE